MAEFVQAQCLHILYISSARTVCAPVFVYVREDSPLRQLHNLTKGGAEGAGRALGIEEEQSRHICTKTACASHSKNMDACVTGQTIHRHSRTLFIFSAMSYVKAIEMTVWAKKNRAEKLRNPKPMKTWRKIILTNMTQNRWGGHEWTNAAEDRASLFPFTSLRVLLPATPSLVFLSVLRIPLPAFRPLDINPSHQYLSLRPPTFKS